MWYVFTYIQIAYIVYNWIPDLSRENELMACVMEWGHLQIRTDDYVRIDPPAQQTAIYRPKQLPTSC